MQRVRDVSIGALQEERSPTGGERNVAILVLGLQKKASVTALFKCQLSNHNYEVKIIISY